MAKRMILLVIVLMVISGGVFAQDRAKNSIALSVGLIGGELSYERMFNRHFSILADVSYTTLFLVDEFTLSAKGRWYPFGKTFFLDLGLGYSYGKGFVGLLSDILLGVITFGYWLEYKDFDDDNFRTGGFLVQPGLGWKIDVGKPDKLVLPIFMGVDLKIWSGMPDIMPYLRIGLGYSF